MEVKEINTNISTRYQFRPTELEKELQKLDLIQCGWQGVEEREAFYSTAVSFRSFSELVPLGK